MGLDGAPADILISALAAFAVIAASLATCIDRRYWDRRLRHWEDRLGERIDVLRVLIADGRDVQRTLTNLGPVSTYHRFVDRCDRVLRDRFGAVYATRIDSWPSAEWAQPPDLRSGEHLFACYDIERRLAGLTELLDEAEGDLQSLSE